MEGGHNAKSLTSMVFSWSIQDILNKQLYKDKMRKIPMTFLSTDQYMKSFIPPLIEETRADLHSSMTQVSQQPSFEILSIMKSMDYKAPHNLIYQVELKILTDSENEEEVVEPETGDLIVLTAGKPRNIDDLNSPDGSYIIAHVRWAKNKLKGDIYDEIEILASKPIYFEEDFYKSKKRKAFFVTRLTNLRTNIRIWKALNSELKGANKNIIKQVLKADSSVVENCSVCFSSEKYDVDVSSLGAAIRSFNLNYSQEDAVLSCTATRECNHQNNMKLLWGPPGTGKTKTVGSLLFALWRRKCKTLTCAPTNVAILEVTSRLLSYIKPTLDDHAYGLGDVILIGNGKRMKIDERDDLLDVFLYYRVDILKECFEPLSGWNHHLGKMISLLENPHKLYVEYLKVLERKEGVKNHDDLGNITFENGKLQEYEQIQLDSSTRKSKRNSQKSEDESNIWKGVICQILDDNKRRWKEELRPKKERYKELDRKEDVVSHDCNANRLSFDDFIKKTFHHCKERLKVYGLNMSTHLPSSVISPRVVKKIWDSIKLLEDLGNSVHNFYDEFKQILSDSAFMINRVGCQLTKESCHQMLKELRDILVLPECYGKRNIKSFCLKNARLIFCTASASAKLHAEEISKLEMLIIDEAAQLKECESTIPLQLPSLRHTILVGDELQLPAMVKSEVSSKAEFGRSLFERLVLLGYKKHLLNVQYRMHPSISLFPNCEFYGKQIHDSPLVKDRSYEKQFLQGKIFSSYSFINVAYGDEESGENGSKKNLVEAAVVSEIVMKLFEESTAEQRVSVGVTSPYKAQIAVIKDKLGKKCSMDDCKDFFFSVRSVDGFQGGEEDIIIMSTVRSNFMGLVGFLSSPQRTNVALTRARQSLWIVGSGTTLANSGSVWERLVVDAKDRGCFYNAEEDERLALAMAVTLVDAGKLDHIFKSDSFLFKTAKWKVFFVAGFMESVKQIKRIEVRKEVVAVIQKLSSGWRESRVQRDLIVTNVFSSLLLELCWIDESLYLVWTVDIQRENECYLQVLKIWDILTLPEIEKRVESLADFIGNHSADELSKRRFRKLEGNLQVPMTWPLDDIQLLTIQLASLSLKD